MTDTSNPSQSQMKFAPTIIILLLGFFPNSDKIAFSSSEEECTTTACKAQEAYVTSFASGFGMTSGVGVGSFFGKAVAWSACSGILATVAGPLAPIACSLPGITAHRCPRVYPCPATGAGHIWEPKMGGWQCKYCSAGHEDC